VLVKKMKLIQSFDVRATKKDYITANNDYRNNKEVFFDHPVQYTKRSVRFTCFCLSLVTKTKILTKHACKTKCSLFSHLANKS